MNSKLQLKFKCNWRFGGRRNGNKRIIWPVLLCCPTNRLNQLSSFITTKHLLILAHRIRISFIFVNRVLRMSRIQLIYYSEGQKSLAQFVIVHAQCACACAHSGWLCTVYKINCDLEAKIEWNVKRNYIHFGWCAVCDAMRCVFSTNNLYYFQNDECMSTRYINIFHKRIKYHLVLLATCMADVKSEVNQTKPKDENVFIHNQPSNQLIKFRWRSLWLFI